MRLLTMLLPWVFALQTSAAEPSYLGSLLERARAERLWRDPYWLILGHYHRNRLGLLRSDARPGDFFLSPRGRRDPRAELEATLNGFFEPPRSSTSSPALMHPQCRFPARYKWLDSKLRFDPAGLPRRPCPDLAQWLEAADPGSATLIFAAAFLNSPGSMYGHTFLRFDRRTHGRGERLLDATINFAANVEDAGSVAGAVRGLTGGLEGRFSAMPYYMKVQEYNNLESRDLWEYELTLSSAALDDLVLHAWEVGSARFRYFFLNKNCSYQLLPLLEAARPDARLAPSRSLSVIPADTLRAVRAVPGLVGAVTYRPSQSTKMRLRRALLTSRERRIAGDLVGGRLETAAASAEALSPDRRAPTLDAASDYLLFLTGPRQDPGERFRRREAAILGMRNKLSEPVAPLERPAWAVPPHEGHATARAELGEGFRGGLPFQEFGIRAALHDLLDPPRGYSPDGQLEMFHARLRREAVARRTYLQEFTVLDITTVAPWYPWVRPTAWRIRTGLEAPDGLEADPWHSLSYAASAGAGRAVGTSLARGEVWYAMASADAGFGPVFRDNYRLGAGIDGGLRIDIAPRWSGLLEARFRGYPVGNPGTYWRVRVGQDLSLSDRFSLRVELGIFESRRDVSVAVHSFL